MQYNESTNGTGIVQSVYWHTGANSNSYDIEDITRNVNFYYKKAVNLIQQSDRDWIWDDSNQTDLPQETADLVSGQKDYGLASDIRMIERVRILDANSTPRKLNPIPHFDNALDREFDTNGTPEYYDLVGESIILYPTPNYNSTDGIKIYPKRSGLLFTKTDTTKEPGFDEQFHDYLALGAAYEYLVANSKRENDATRLKNELNTMEQDMVRFYSRRSGQQKLSVRVENNL